MTDKPMTDPIRSKPRLIPATARITPQRKPTKAQRIRQQRQIKAWRKRENLTGDSKSATSPEVQQ